MSIEHVGVQIEVLSRRVIIYLSCLERPFEVCSSLELFLVVQLAVKSRLLIGKINQRVLQFALELGGLEH